MRRVYLNLLCPVWNSRLSNNFIPRLSLQFARSLQLSSVHNQLMPQKPVITIPVPVEKRALKRHQNIRKLAKEQDKIRLKDKPLVIACKRSELNHKLGQTYGKLDAVHLASQGWKNRKSYDDYFTINGFQSIKAKYFMKDNETRPKFSQLQYLDPALVAALKSCGFEELTNIQAESLPTILEDKESHSLLAAETGNGKTLCFLLPILQNIIRLKGSVSVEVNNRPNRSPLAVVVAPSRELANQIEGVARHLAEQLGVKVELFLGGSALKLPSDQKHGQVDLAVGSFGGLVKLFGTGYLKRKYVTEIALDEVDTLLDDTFKDSLLQFLKRFGRSGLSLMTGTRLLMAGATFPTNFDNYMSSIVELENINKFSTNQIHKVLYHLPQKFIRVSSGRKLKNFTDILEKSTANKNKKILVFCNKTTTAEFLNHHLRENNFKSVNFNHNVPPTKRAVNYREFACGETNIMIATDLASRGLDTTMVQHVINYDFPLNVADYIHRVGRVGRVGSCGGGHVTSLVDTPLGVDVLQRIEMAVRKDKEIVNVNNNIIRIIKHRASKKEEQEFD